MLQRIISLIRAFLSRLFARRSPIGFKRELGSWQEPDVILNDDADLSRPLVIDDCTRSVVVYAVHLERLQVCNFPAEIRALLVALGIAQTYFEQQFRCPEDKDCPQKAADLLWIGSSCRKDPVTVTAAVLVRFRCEIER